MIHSVLEQYQFHGCRCRSIVIFQEFLQYVFHLRAISVTLYALQCIESQIDSLSKHFALSKSYSNEEKKHDLVYSNERIVGCDGRVSL